MYTNQVYNPITSQNKIKPSIQILGTQPIYLPHSQQRNIQITRYTINLPISYTPNLNIQISLTKIQIPLYHNQYITNTNIHTLGSWFIPFLCTNGGFSKKSGTYLWRLLYYTKHYSSQNLKY